MDGRVKPGHDEGDSGVPITAAFTSAFERFAP